MGADAANEDNRGAAESGERGVGGKSYAVIRHAILSTK